MGHPFYLDTWGTETRGSTASLYEDELVFWPHAMLRSNVEMNGSVSRAAAGLRSSGGRSDLSAFALRDMVECGRGLRAAAEGCPSMEAAARRIVHYLHEHLVDGTTGERNCVLVRCFKTHSFGRLPSDLAAAAQGMLHGEFSAEMPCLTLLATAGELPEWNERRLSRGHSVIPLVSVEMVERAPMIAALFRQLGLGVAAALEPNPQFILDADERVFNVFHVEHAQGDATIPSQEQFVRPFGVRSVLGVGGLLPTGDLFTVILFSRVLIPRETASLFRTIALGVKLALLPHTRGRVFDEEGESAAPVAEARAGVRVRGGATEEEALRSEGATLRLLILALEDAALDQTQRLQSAYDELKQEGEKVKMQENRLSAMLQATTDAVFMVDRAWRFTFLNRHAEVLLARGVDLIGQNLWEMFPDAAGRAYGKEYKRAMEEGVEVAFQEYYPEPLNRWFEVHGYPSQEGIAVFFQDVTERLDTDAKLRQTEKLAATGKLAASVAHEINNPLEAMTNLLYLVAQDESIGPETRTYLALVDDELQRVTEITTQMLRFYRQSTDAAEVDLVEVVESVLTLFKGRLAQANVSVARRLPGRANLTGYGGELRQIIANLVGNAIDACRLGGRLAMRIRCVAGGDGRPGLRLTVADTGKGMSAATQKRIFEPFFTTKGITGTGLGLWVSLELIRKHHGTVRVRSSDRVDVHGTVFQLFFPARVEGLEGQQGAGAV